MQEKVAENMLLLTRNLKEQTQLASRIIKKDTEVFLLTITFRYIKNTNSILYFITDFEKLFQIDRE